MAQMLLNNPLKPSHSFSREEDTTTGTMQYTPLIVRRGGNLMMPYNRDFWSNNSRWGQFAML